MENKYSGMTVEELRQEMRSRGLPQQENGKKFTKTQLIEKLMEDDKTRTEMWDDKEAEQTAEENTEESDKWLPDFWREDGTFDEEGHAESLENLREIYEGRTPRWAFDYKLKPGSYIAYVQSRNGRDRLRTAKVIGVNRTKRLIKAERYVGECDIVPYEKVMFIVDKEKGGTFPYVIRTHMARTRTPEQKERLKEIHERENNAASY